MQFVNFYVFLLASFIHGLDSTISIGNSSTVSTITSSELESNVAGASGEYNVSLNHRDDDKVDDGTNQFEWNNTRSRRSFVWKKYPVYQQQRRVIQRPGPPRWVQGRPVRVQQRQFQGQQRWPQQQREEDQKFFRESNRRFQDQMAQSNREQEQRRIQDVHKQFVEQSQRQSQSFLQSMLQDQQRQALEQSQKAAAAARKP